MKIALLAMVAILAGGSSAPEIASKHFALVRDISAPNTSGKQPYVVADEALWNGSTRALADVRFYANGKEVPFVMNEQGAKSGMSAIDARILNEGSVNGETEFVIESPIDETDTITLNLDAHDFTSRAEIAGADQVPASTWTQLGTFSLFDFTKEQLGENKTIRLKTPVRFKYLRVRITDSIKPADVTGASVSDYKREAAKYTIWSTTPKISEQGNKTLIEWAGSERMPLEHVQFTVNPADINFSRTATLFCGHDTKSAATGKDVLAFDQSASTELTRVKMVRKQHPIEYESLELAPGALRCKQYKIEIANRSDRPLGITAVAPQSIERRFYWKADVAAAPQLYYGDDKVDSPRYDFAMFFDEPAADAAVQAQLGPERKNPEYVARADERPFSERYPGVMWGVMVLAVLGLGAWAVRGFKS